MRAGTRSVNQGPYLFWRDNAAEQRKVRMGKGGIGVRNRCEPGERSLLIPRDNVDNRHTETRQPALRTCLKFVLELFLRGGSFL